MEIVDVLKPIGEGTAWLLTLYFAKGWIEAKVLEPLAELKKDVSEAKHESINASNEAKGAAFKVMAQAIELNQTVNRETHKMSTLFSQAAQLSIEAKAIAQNTADKVKDLAIETDTKLRNVGANLLGKIKVIEKDVEKIKSDTTEIRKDVFYIKGKKDDGR